MKKNVFIRCENQKIQCLQGFEPQHIAQHI